MDPSKSRARKRFLAAIEELFDAKQLSVTCEVPEVAMEQVQECRKRFLLAVDEILNDQEQEFSSRQTQKIAIVQEPVMVSWEGVVGGIEGLNCAPNPPERKGLPLTAADLPNIQRFLDKYDTWHRVHRKKAMRSLTPTNDIVVPEELEIID